MICPVCQEPLIILEYQDVEMDYCPVCRGVWLDQGELEFVLDIPGKHLDLSAITHFSRGKRRCPRCHRKMVKGHFPSSEVEVDICRRDLGIWLDQGEMIRLAEGYSPTEAFSKINRLFAELFTHKSEIKEE